MILTDFGRALAQLADRRFRRVLWLGLGITLLLLILFYAGFLWFIEWLDPGSFVLPVFGQISWAGDLLGWVGLGVMLFLSMVLMIPVASAITSLFLDDVADAVEAQYYPDLPPVPRVGFLQGLAETFGFLGLMIVANLAALVIGAFLPFGYPVIFYLMNGWLLGREYFQIAALRREGAEGARALRRRHSGEIWLAGCLMALPLSVPLVNLFIPVLGAATFTHLYHRLRGRSAIPPVRRR